ncbi:hypothetical protein RHGRI_027239 [Rhododendron griersonianum]|uniref:Uncharacterized protein n=1 Tax=Rhododendron griersonianum TaxID=479676 RepID=A0AAV6J045_9ERIC|nr:hypothetical protein RHGRI_027239 [Rhododendron griersonianum]
MSIGRKGMDASNQKSIERVVSQRALQMGSSFPCQICVVGFLCGVCLATFFLAALTSLGTFAFGGISFSASSNGITSGNSSSAIINMVTKGDCNLKPREIGRLMHSQLTFDSKIDARVSFLYSAWSASLNEPVKGEGELLQGVGVRRSNVPKAPHLENCKLSSQVNKNLDKLVENESFPPWTLWKGFLHTYPLSTAGERLKSEGAYPPWEVIDRSRSYPHWNFYYTNVTRQVGNMSMATYEASLGRETSTNYPLVNFLMAAESDFFVGALGSSWCFLIDGMRNTGGKVMAGYLSVNKDRFW